MVYKVSVAQPLPLCATNHAGHLIDGVMAARVVASLELANVMDQNDSIPLICACPRTYSPTP